jgi:hypothetical protein
MPTTNTTKSDVLPIRITAAMRKQLDFLAAAGFGNQTDIVRLAVDRMYQQESPRKVRAPHRQVMIETVADRVHRGIINEADVRRINTGEGWTYDVGDDQHWTRYTGVRMSEGEMAEALRLAAEWTAE